MKNIKSNFKSPQRRKIEENKTTNESTLNIFVARFSFGVLPHEKINRDLTNN